MDMKRKVIKQGNNTLTITLPRQWCEKFNVKGGDEIDLTESEKSIIISNTDATLQMDSITLDISNVDKTTAAIWIQGLYRYGYDSMTVSSSSQLLPHYRIDKDVSISKIIHDIASRFIGSEIISSSASSFQIKRIAQESQEEFENVLRRIFLLLKEMMEVFIESLEKKSIEGLESIELHHVNIKKFINYSLRLLNKFGHIKAKKTSFYFSIIQYLSKIDDLIKNSARYIIKYKFEIGLKAINHVKNIHNSIKLYYEMFYSYGLKKVSSLNEWRDSIRNGFLSKVKDLSKDEIVIVSGLMQIVELLLDMTELRMALEN
jgi:phosphate uptake regulator